MGPELAPEVEAELSPEAVPEVGASWLAEPHDVGSWCCHQFLTVWVESWIPKSLLTRLVITGQLILARRHSTIWSSTGRGR